MNEITTFVKKYLGELLTIIGTGIFAYNVLNFYTRDGVTYYPEDILVAISIGAMLIVLGIVIMKQKNKSV